MKRSLFTALALVVLGACSHGNGAAPGTGDQASSASPPTCQDTCYGAFPSGEALLTPLDDCVVEACQPLDDAPSAGDAGAGEACSAVGTGKGQVSYAYAPTDSCIARACCAEARACAGDARCAGLNACLRACPDE